MERMIITMFNQNSLNLFRITKVISFIVPTLTLACLSTNAAQEGPIVLQAGAPGQPSRTLDPQELTSIVQPAHHQADVAFMKGMIHHHNQALEMAAMIGENTRSEELFNLGRRITISQEDEITFMGRWLADREERRPPHQGPDQPSNMAEMLMPGMLSQSEMESLRNATNEDFDRLFLEGMIKHHEGALTMVATLFNTSGAGEEPEIFQFAYHVDSDQYIEIERMTSMLEARR
ncbi:MAG: DUF305 domain-containing protein [Gemmatimonadetes bacterium]|nr:DUF305 domain-containing protein [Gemmatimonadota bacterium]|tara:strand:- start:70 stop:768 length:699 start_codon:yes stop_codon:yes gene_type:complete